MTDINPKNRIAVKAKSEVKKKNGSTNLEEECYWTATQSKSMFVSTKKTVAQRTHWQRNKEKEHLSNSDRNRRVKV